MPSTPSYFVPGSCEVSWLPQAEVAPSFSLRETSRRARWGCPFRVCLKRAADPGCALRRRWAVDVIESSSLSSIGERTLPLAVRGSHFLAPLEANRHRVYGQ